MDKGTQTMIENLHRTQKQYFPGSEILNQKKHKKTHGWIRKNTKLPDFVARFWLPVKISS